MVSAVEKSAVMVRQAPGCHLLPLFVESHHQVQMLAETPERWVMVTGNPLLQGAVGSQR